MKLSWLMNELASHQPRTSEYRTYVLRVADGSSERADVEYDEFPILDIDVEHEGREITFVTNERVEGGGVSAEDPAMGLNEMSARLAEVAKECSDYEIFSGSAIFDLSEGFFGRLDVPITAVAWNDDARSLGLL
jgi:hypothetical protein